MPRLSGADIAMRAPNYCFHNGEHDPCHYCGAPVLRRPGECKRGWKYRACCCDQCSRRAKADAARHRVLPQDLPLSKAQIGEWPAGVRFEDVPTAPVACGSVGLPPIAHSPAGTAGAACAEHRWAER